MDTEGQVTSCPVSPVQGCGLGELESGGYYLRIHYTADPSKRDPSYKEEGVLARGRAWWEQQMEMSEDVFTGEAVFKEFDYNFHCPPIVRTESVPVFEGSLFVAGWDTGQTHQHAMELAMITPIGQVFWILEAVPSEGCPLSAFAPVAVQMIKERLPGHWMDVYHVADPAGRQRAGTDFVSAFTILEEYGVALNAAWTNSPQIREDAVNWLLRRKITTERGTVVPGVVYSEKDCPVLVEGMKGAYCLTEPKQGVQGFAKVLRSPVKNFYSHANDAHQYASLEIRRILSEGETASKWANI